MSRPPDVLFAMALAAIGLALLSFLLSVPQWRSETQYKQGVAALSRGNYSQARRSFENAMNLERKQPMFYAAHALATFRAASSGAAMPSEPWRSLPVPTTEDEVLLREAAGDYRKALSLSPNDATFWSNLGWIEAELHQEAAASDALHTAVLADPQDAAGRVSLGLLDERGGLVKDALEQYGQALAASPRLIDSPFFSELKARNPSGAALGIGRCLDLLNGMPKSPAVRASLAKVHAYQGHYEPASREYTEALKELPDLSYAWANLGSADRATGNTAIAQTDFQRALALYSWNRPAANNLASLAFANGDREGARRFYTRTLLTPLLSTHANRVARVYHVPWVDADDLVPSGLLEYINPPIEPLNLCGRWLDDLSRTFGGFPLYRNRIAGQQKYCAAQVNVPGSRKN